MATILETLSTDLAAAADAAGRATVAVHARRRIPASGVLWRPGLVVATHHTVHKDDDVRITLEGGRTARGSVTGRDPGTDLVVLRLDGDAGTPATVHRDPLRVGQLALAVGRPGDAITAALGVVSAVGPAWRTWHGGEIDQFVRLDVSVYDGFSGGPLVDAAGRVLGINTSALARAAAVTIPAATVDRVVDQLLAGGRVRRGYLGIGTQQVRLPDAVRTQLGEQQMALMLVAIEPGAPAEQGGLLLGDVLVALGDRATEDVDDVLAALGGDTVGQQLDARVLRAGELRTVPVTIGDAPARR
ncbi:serine protease [Gemmatimonadetes bacterium T265]|nr:serine protease [Gemmatimonadetes bacterium T265]